MARRAVRVIGPGRAGRSLHAAFEKAGWRALPPLGREASDAEVRAAADGVDLLVIATPDAAVAEVAAAVAPVATTVVAHMAGSLTLDALAPHERRASLHPLRSIPDGSTNLSGAWFAVEGDELAREAVEAIGGRPIAVTGSRAVYHAAAVVASNHLVALLGQVERIAASVGLPLDAFFDLVRGTVDNVELLGPKAALTGPVSRGDWETVLGHIDALDEDERVTYKTFAFEAARLVGGLLHTLERRTHIYGTIASFRAAMNAARAAGKTVGLVPTMGALHDGHASLIRRASEECGFVAVTIFVNPRQFGAGEDFECYPRNLEADVQAVRQATGAHVYVFAPPVEQMYPGSPDGLGGLTTVHVDAVSEGMEGAVRPGHFDGVATVVTKLFNIAGPCRAYFGEKDWQQLQVVRQLVYDLDIPVDVVACPTVREPDGLAMSSRNVYLSPEERRAATTLYRALLAGKAAPADPVEAAKRVLESEPLIDIDYVELHGTRLLVAARVGTTRLIDNMEL